MMSNFMFDEEEQREEPEALGGALDRGVVPVAIKAMQVAAVFAGCNGVSDCEIEFKADKVSGGFPGGHAVLFRAFAGPE